VISDLSQFLRPDHILPSLVDKASMQRVKQLAAHLASAPVGVAALQRELPDDVVITMAIRSPLCKARKGGFKDARYARSVGRRISFSNVTLTELMS
jgi:hypothetical protein